MIGAVGLAELLETASLLPAGKELVEEQHRQVRDQHEDTGPDEKGAESDDREPEVLRVTGDPVEPAGDESPASHLRPIHLDEAEGEQRKAQKHERRSQNREHVQDGTRRV